MLVYVCDECAVAMMSLLSQEFWSCVADARDLCSSSRYFATGYLLPWSDRCDEYDEYDFLLLVKMLFVGVLWHCASELNGVGWRKPRTGLLPVEKVDVVTSYVRAAC